MIMWTMVSGATLSPRWEGPPRGKANRKVSQAWKCFCGSWDRNFSHTHPLPSIPPHCSVQLKPSSSNSGQVQSFHHLGIDYTCRWEPRKQNQDASFARGFSSTPSLGLVPVLTLLHFSIPALPMTAWQVFIQAEAFHFTCLQPSWKGREIPELFSWVALSNPTPLTIRRGRKQQLLCVWVKPSHYFFLPADISLDGKRIFKSQRQAALVLRPQLYKQYLVPSKALAEQQRAVRDCSFGRRSLSAPQLSPGILGRT